ncbi:putative membrane protein [Chryseobacterium sp. SORGH_AS909]|uniref:Membrane protein n=1 Tax=Chryseobacterium camelliae TaxID=1265445 RepID=A0ABU0TLQ1_9FLAO|nr:putative membrane protein [Chryseobacterium camelliae]MDQ1101907.1 putative membrane protein [Chryseobacterium sp. SORGH_AS_1048]MDR6085347.1 putative membrane protein [Chryseobacterium sp. SORGH_AS_0909]MDR6129705.1 putative membrane protein [Chryseobacterium sp. SORGH_AS_1175]MDT3408167.1 putative membrane protein [Pseudacidovorax intermedius]
MTKIKSSERFFLNISPLQRGIISLLAAALVFFLIFRLNLKPLIILIFCWLAFSVVFLFLDWQVILHRKVDDIRKKARADDGNAFFVFTTIIVASLASMFAIFFLVTSKDKGIQKEIYFLPAVLGAMILSWIMVQTQYIFHYAREYYDEDSSGEKEEIGGLEFPTENKDEIYHPDYMDFAYYSFCMGCTFQVSDVSITSRNLRKITMIHGLLAFFMNTFVVALTINLVAGLNG